MTYAADQLLAEVAYLAQAIPWSFDTLLDLEHADRQRFIALVGDPSADD